MRLGCRAAFVARVRGAVILDAFDYPVFGPVQEFPAEAAAFQVAGIKSGGGAVCLPAIHRHQPG